MSLSENGGFYSYDADGFNKMRKIFDINFFSHVKLLNLFMPELRKSQGRVAVISSISGDHFN